MKNRQLALRLAGLFAAPFLLAVAYGEEIGLSSLPVRAVSLFSSGVGYFQHAGFVNGSSSLTLHFKDSQINDMLKSLVVEDLDGGHPGSVTYPSQDPLQRVLGEFQVDLTDNPGLPKILDRIRGSRVTAHLGSETVTGTVLGAESRTRYSEDDKVAEEWLLNLLEATGLRTIPLSDIRQLEMLDATLKRELDNALTTLDQSRGQDRKTVSLSFAGEGKRRVRIGYVVEAPLWKNSYRLLISQAKNQQATLQGWAIVENQTEADWEKVTVSLVNGKPISFSQDLYRPQYITRPVVKAELTPPPPPPAYPRPVRPKALMMPEAGPGGYADREMSGESAGGTSSRWEDDPVDPSRLTSVADSSEVGELYQFTVADISLPRRKSAMIPIIAGTIGVEKVSIYNQEVRSGQPLNGILLHNTSGQHLPAGPITLFDEGVYAGDSRIKDVPPNGKRLLSYAVDQEVQVIASPDAAKEEIMAGRFVQGMLVLTRKHRIQKEYTFSNSGVKEKQIIVEHPARAGWELIETQAPYEATEQWQRFRLVVAPQGEGRLVVRQERVAEQSIAILNEGIDFLHLHIKNAAIAAPVRQALEKAAGLKWALQETERQIEESERIAESFREEQERVRANIQVLRPATQQHDHMTRKLMDLEGNIEKQLSVLDVLHVKQQQQRQELEKMLEGLTLE